MVANVIK